MKLLSDVRKFRCPHAGCSRRIFTERLPDLAKPYARKTVRLQEVLKLVGFALGGNAGARLIGRLGMETSPTALLHYIRVAAAAIPLAPEVIGIDDFALLRGKSYGMIIVDQQSHHPIELLPDRFAETLTSSPREFTPTAGPAPPHGLTASTSTGCPASCDDPSCTTSRTVAASP